MSFDSTSDNDFDRNSSDGISYDFDATIASICDRMRRNLGHTLCDSRSEDSASDELSSSEATSNDDTIKLPKRSGKAKQRAEGCGDVLKGTRAWTAGKAQSFLRPRAKASQKNTKSQFREEYSSIDLMSLIGTCSCAHEESCAPKSSPSTSHQSRYASESYSPERLYEIYLKYKHTVPESDEIAIDLSEARDMFSRQMTGLLSSTRT